MTDDCGCSRINCYALVAYIPDPLARFLDQLRRDLVPECLPHAHVTLMPPRELKDEAAALRQAQEYFAHVPPFEVGAGDVAVFTTSAVIYVEIGVGRNKLFEIHEDLNRDALRFCAKYPFHPHITLAQEFPLADLDGKLEVARKAWAAYPYPRQFTVTEAAFVQCREDKSWVDLATVKLGQPVGAGR